MKESIQKVGKFLSGMVMPNIGAFIAWGFITALFIPDGWFPNESLASIVGPMLKYLITILIGYQGGKMLAGDRGAVIAAIATMGVIAGADQIMLMGAMLMGPLAGFVIKKFDDNFAHRLPAGFEMLINNFSVGILGMLLAIFGYYLIGPFMAAILGILTAGVAVLIDNNLLPFAAVFVEPAKVLFLNNAINHGIFTPIGIEQASLTGKSIMYLLEANPGPGLGVLVAYWLFAKDKTTRDTAPGAAIIHFFGGIHEIYFPYILMNPVLIVAPIAASVVTIFYYSLFSVGLVGPASPGSIIAFLAVAPKGETLSVLIGVIIASAISFLVASPIIKMSAAKNLADAQSKMQDMKAQSKGTGSIKTDNKINIIIFACDAGMGSSAMGATKFRKRIEPLNLGITVTNKSVDSIPPDADIVVCQATFIERVNKSSPKAQVVTIANFLADPALDNLYESLQGNNAEEKPEVMVAEGIKLGCKPVSKEEAIKTAGELLQSLGCVESDYVTAMLEREKISTTYMGEGVAIPHGTDQAKKFVKKTGIVFFQYPDGIDFGDEKAYMVFGIAGIGEEHIDLLSKISEYIDEEKAREILLTAKNPSEILALFKD